MVAFAVATFLCVAVAVPNASAINSSKSHILILNSFDESNPWIQEYINGLVYHLVNVKGVATNVRHLNAEQIVDDSTFNAAIKNNLDKFGVNPPSGVILMGRQAFAAREELNKKWKNIPMLYMAENLDVLPQEYEYAGSDVSDAPVVTLNDMRDRYNFTFVRIEDHYKQTIDMMMKMQPKMKNFKLASNSISTSLQLRDSVQKYLHDKYPKVTFEWINAEDEGSGNKLKNLLSKRDLETGILMGNWYHKEFDQDGNPIYSAGDVELISKSPQPVFTVKENYFKTGVVGGVLPIRADIMAKSKDVIDRMLKGDDMRQIPLDKGEKGGACIDYPQLAKTGLEKADVPANTSYINKPDSVFSKNPLAFAVALLIFISIVQLVMYYLLFKGRTDSFMKKREIKINHLPVNYFIGKVRYNDEGKPEQIETTPGNQKAIELWERHAGECRCEPLFDEEEMLKAVEKLTDESEGVVYTEHFKKTDSYYEVNIHRGFDVDTLEIFCFDITQRIRSAQELKYTSTLFEMTLDLAQIVPWHWDLSSGKIELKYNEALRKINKNLISSNGNNVLIPQNEFFRMIHPEDKERVMQIGREVREGKKKYLQLEFRILIDHGNKKVEEWLEVNETVERYDEDGKPSVLIGSFARITERKEQMHRLIEAREAAKEADRLKSAFLANMSHEIRTPLNAIVGFSNMLADTEDPVQKQKFIKIIESNNDMLLQIISDILDLSKTEAGTMEFNMRPIDINALLVNIGESVINRVKPGVDLLCNFGAEMCWLDTDPNRLSQVVSNFLTNASKFTEEGSISFGYEVRDENLYFYCVDTGSGISEENQKKVFERFIKLNSFVNGTGLGLPICKAIVEFLGGKIGVFSEGEGFGSTFWFEIPYRKVPVPEGENAPLWTEPLLNLTIMHAKDLAESHPDQQPEDNSSQAPVQDHVDSQETAQPFAQQYPPQGMPYDPQLPPQGMPYDPQFPPQGMPYDPQFPPQGMPYDPQFPPQGMPYDPQFPPQGMPYDPQFPPQGMPYDPQFPPQGMPGGPQFPPQGMPGGPQFPPQGMPGGPQFPSQGMPIEQPVEEIPGGQTVVSESEESVIVSAPESGSALESVEEVAVVAESGENSSDEDASNVADTENSSSDEEKSEEGISKEIEEETELSEEIFLDSEGDDSESDEITSESDEVSAESVVITEEIAVASEDNASPAEIDPQSEEKEECADNLTENNKETEDMSQQINPNQANDPNNQQQFAQNPYGQNPYGQQYPPQNPYGQYPPQNPYGQYPPQNPYGQYPPQNPHGQYPPQKPYGQHPPQNPYRQYPPQNPYGQQ